MSRHTRNYLSPLGFAIKTTLASKALELITLAAVGIIITAYATSFFTAQKTNQEAQKSSPDVTFDITGKWQKPFQQTIDYSPAP